MKFEILKQLTIPTFAQKMIGDGFAYIPTNNVFKAPFAGTVTTVFPTKHAYGIKREDGVEVLIHIGINTVNENGNHFKSLVKQGDYVKAGQKIAEVELDALKNKGYDTTTMLIFPKNEKFEVLCTIVNGKEHINVKEVNNG